jgi:hypothetical protein
MALVWLTEGIGCYLTVSDGGVFVGFGSYIEEVLFGVGWDG